MSKFVVKNIEGVKGKQSFKQLVVIGNEADTEKLQKQIDNAKAPADTEDIYGQLDIYESELETSYDNSVDSIYSIMNRVADLQPVSNNKFKDVTPKGETIKEYEIKAGDLRVFVIKIPNGKLVVLGGYKNQQKADFKKFRSLKKQYLDSLK